MALIYADTEYQQTLSMSRYKLDAVNYDKTLVCESHEELCLYLLVGAVDVSILWAGTDTCSTVSLDAGRRTVQEPSVSILRIPCGHKAVLSMKVASYAADILAVTNAQKNVTELGPMQYLVQTTCHNHHVGTGTHERWVREAPTPPGYTIHCGETLNVPGGWSSWPSHCAPDEAARYAEHEELFFVVTPGYGLMHCDGRYPDGTRAPQVQRIANGQALRTPLGSHEIVFSPEDWGYYAWFYRSFLKKQYNRWATDGVKTYVK